MELNIELRINSQSKLACLDNSTIDVDGHVSLEYIIPVDAIKQVQDGTATTCPDAYIPGTYKKTSILDLPEDGTMIYIKLGVPSWEHINGLVDKDEILCYKSDDEDIDHFYIARESFTKASEDISTYSQLEEIKLNSLLHMYYIASRIPGTNTQSFYYEKKIFSIWNLQQCLVNLQRELLEKTPCSCNECGIEKDTIYRRDFLLASLYVFDYLKDINNFEKAQDLLDRLNRSCDWLCGKMNKSNDCGCGKSIR